MHKIKTKIRQNKMHVPYGIKYCNMAINQGFDTGLLILTPDRSLGFADFYLILVHVSSVSVQDLSLRVTHKVLVFKNLSQKHI